MLLVKLRSRWLYQDLDKLKAAQRDKCCFAAGASIGADWTTATLFYLKLSQCGSRIYNPFQLTKMAPRNAFGKRPGHVGVGKKRVASPCAPVATSQQDGPASEMTNLSNNQQVGDAKR
jgi:hypothetical protein